MKTAVIYKSKTGNAKKYANLIAKELHADLYHANEFHVERLFNYDTIVYGGGLYIRGIYGIRDLVNNLNVLEGKNIVVFATGATHPLKQDVNGILRSNFTDKELKRIKFFYLYGGINHDRLSLIDRIIVKFLKLRLKYTKNKTPDQQSLLEAYQKTIDHRNEEDIKHIVDYINSLEQ